MRGRERGSFRDGSRIQGAPEQKFGKPHLQPGDGTLQSYNNAGLLDYT